MISAAESMVNGTVLVWVWRVTENPVLKSLRKFYSDGWDLREHLQRRARQVIIGETSIQRKLFLNEYNMETKNFKRRNSEYALIESHLKDNNYWKPIRSSSTRERDDICVADWRWRIIFIKTAMQEVENWKVAAIREEITENNEDWKNFLLSMIRNHE